MPHDSDFDENIRQKLQDYGAMPSPHLWEKIQPRVPVAPPFYKSPRIQWLSAGALLAVVGLAYFFSQYRIEADINIKPRHRIFAETGISDSLPTPIAVARSPLTSTPTGNPILHNDKVLLISEAEGFPAHIIATPTAQGPTINTVTGALGLPAKHTPGLPPSIQTLTRASEFTLLNAITSPATTLNPLSSSSATEISASPHLAAGSPSPSENLKNSEEYPPLPPAHNHTFLPTVLHSLLAATLPTAGNTYTIRSEIPKRCFKTELPNNLLVSSEKSLSTSGFASISQNWISGAAKELDLHQTRGLGTSYGLAITYDLNRKWAIQTELTLNSKIHQEYEIYVGEEGMYRATNVLDYIQVPLLIKNKKTIYVAGKNMPLVRHLVMGLRYGQLKSVHLNLSSPSIHAIDLLNKHEAGIILGWEYQLFLNRNYSVSLGARGAMSTAFNHGSEMSATHKPLNLSLGLQTGLHYKFVRK